MLKTTLGQLMINEALPAEMRDYDRVMTGKELDRTLQHLAENYPDEYRQATKQLSDVGKDASFVSGGQSFGLRNLRTLPAAKAMKVRMARKLQQIYADPKLSDKERDEKIIIAAGEEQTKLVATIYDEARAEGNPLADQIDSGARGNKHNLNSLLGGDMLYTNHRGDPIPIPVIKNYSQGLSPAEYFASAYGARKGIMDLKSATQDAGFFAKQLVQGAHRLLVTQDDDDDEYDEARPRGMPVSTDDIDSEGALLAHPVGGLPRNTELTPRILKELRTNGIDEILVRSPTVGGPGDGGVYARDVGRRERGRVSPVGDFVGIAAAQALAEPVTQAQISSKHSGGVVGAGAGAISGFKYINQLVQVPKKFKGGAAHAQLDGRISSIEDAPQGGKYIEVGGQRHYVGQGFDPKVKVGDVVEAGDMISEGIPNPSELVKHKGIGEGRRAFVDLFRDALSDSGTYGNRRNIELVARGLINHVRLTDEVGDYVQDDVVPYATMERNWQPREGTISADPRKAVGKYLERPVLHYSIGTPIQKGMLARLKQHGVKSVDVHAEPPPFESTMIRAMENVSHDPDWMTRMLGSYQQRSLLEGTRRGAVSDSAGTSYVAPLAQAVDFGRKGLTQGWKPDADITGQ